jgi:hypothetical protein
MRITQRVDSASTNGIGDIYITNGITSVVVYEESVEGGKDLTLMIHGKVQIKLPFQYTSTEPMRIGLDESGDISMTSISPVMGILRPCALDENGVVIPKNAGDLHGCFWFGGCH